MLCCLSMLAAWTNGRASPGDDCNPKTEDCVVVGRWNFGVALGAGVRTNPLVTGKDLPLVVVPQVSYYGRRFFLDNLDLGFTAAGSESNTLNVIATPGYDRIFFYTGDLQNIFVDTGNVGVATGGTTGPPTGDHIKIPTRSRPVTYLAGPEWTFSLSHLYGQLDVLHEITGHNHGSEVRAALGFPLIEGSGTLKASLGLTWQSAAIVDFYFGVPAIYEGGNVLRPFAKVDYTRPLGRGWRLNAFAQYERLGSAIADSPLVADDYVVTVFIGAVYGW